MFLIKVIKIILIIIAVLILGLLIALGVCCKLAFTDDNVSKYTTEADISCSKTIAVNALVGNETDITNDEINGIVNYFVKIAEDKDFLDEDFTVKGVCVEVNSSEQNHCYVQLSVKGRLIGVSADFDIEVDSKREQLNVSLSNTKIGRLKVSEKFLAKMIKKYSDSFIADRINGDDASFNVPSTYQVEVPVLGQIIPFEVESIQFRDGAVHIETNAVLNDTLTNLRDIIIRYFADDIKNFDINDLNKFNIKDFLNRDNSDFSASDIPESWGEKIGDFLSGKLTQ